MALFTGPRGAGATVAAYLIWWSLVCPQPTHAATREVLAAAAVCARIDWRDQAGAARAATYRQAVACLKALYVRVARGPDGHTGFDTELTTRLDALETAYRASRDVCGLRTRWEIEKGGCGTIGLAAHEFVALLKTMILDEDAGWVRHDPALARALQCCNPAPLEVAVVARGERAAIAGVCTDGQFGLLVTADPAAAPWAGGNWQAIDVVDVVHESWRWRGRAPARSAQWYRLEDEAAAWSVPNPRSHMARVVARSTAGDLYWQLWLPGDDPSAAGRWIPAGGAVVARMWLLATAC